MSALKLTKRHKERLAKIAKSAQKIARKCKAGKMKLESHACFNHNLPQCAFGHVIHDAYPQKKINYLSSNIRALNIVLGRESYAEIPNDLSRLLTNIAKANDRASVKTRNKSVVEPLRKLASAINRKIKTEEVWNDPHDNA